MKNGADAHNQIIPLTDRTKRLLNYKKKNLTLSHKNPFIYSTEKNSENKFTSDFPLRLSTETANDSSILFLVLF